MIEPIAVGPGHSRATQPHDRAALTAVKASTRRLLFQRLERGRAFLHEHADRNVSLAELGRITGVSRFHFSRNFRQAFGQSPIAYHRAVRLERAALYLTRGEGNVAEAAELVGYSDPAALGHAFRKEFGCAPLRFAMRRRDMEEGTIGMAATAEPEPRQC